MKPRPIAWTLSLGLALAAAITACSDDHDDGHSHDPGAHEPKNPSCIAIMGACHSAATEPGPADDCHTLAHKDVEGDCAAQRTSCVQTCDAILADAGVD